MSIREYPKKPGISRFVAPWDTSGWYFMAEHFAPGCRIYSNADITVTECPEILMGCDYIVTYDSATDGFDDKQEVDFFIEQTGEVYAALDADALRIFRRALHARIWSSGRTQAILIACSCAPTHAVRMSIWTLSPAPDGTSSWSFARQKQKRKSRCPKQSASRGGTARDARNMLVCA